jgi:hypothetical protein
LFSKVSLWLRRQKKEMSFQFDKARIIRYAPLALAVIATSASVFAQSPFSVGATKVSTDMTGPIARAGVSTGIVAAGLSYVVGQHSSHEKLSRLFMAGSLMGFATAIGAWIFT